MVNFHNFEKALPSHAYPLCHCDPVLDSGVGNLVAVATAVRWRVFSPIEFATSFDKLGMILQRAQDERKILAMTD